jgi:TolA-binding protein
MGREFSSHVRVAVLLAIGSAGALGTLHAEPKPSSTPANPPAPTVLGTGTGTSTNALQIQVISPSAEQFDRASALFGQGDYAGALKEFSALVKNYPGSSRIDESFYRIAECYRYLGKSADARAAYAYLIKTYPDTIFLTAAQLRTGDLAFQAGDFAGAIAPLQVALAKGDAVTKLAATYLLGAAQVQTGDYKSGRPLLESLLASKDKDAAAYAAPAAQALAQSYDKEGKPEQSLKYWQRVLALAENKSAQSMAAARGGWAALQINNTKEAEALFETCRRLDTGSDWRKVANTGLVRLYYQQKRFQDLLDLRHDEPSGFLEGARAEIFLAVARSWFELKKYPDAVDAFDVYLKDYGDKPEAPDAAYQRLLARAQIDQANIETDTAAFLGKYANSPLVWRVQWLRAEDFSRRQKFAQVIPMWQALLQLDNKELPLDQILFELGRAYYSEKKWMQAAETYGRFADEFSKNPAALSARVRQAIALQNAGQAEGSAVAWEKARVVAGDNSPERQMALEQLGLIYCQLGKNDRAVPVFADLLKNFPQTRVRALASYTLGSDAFQKKDYKNAEGYLLEARKLEAATYSLSADERLALLAFALQDYKKTTAYSADYEKDAAATPATAKNKLPAALYFWLGQQSQNVAKFDAAITAFSVVVNHPQAGEFGTPAWWLLAESQRAAGQFKAAVASYQTYRQKNPPAANSTEVLLALAQADLGAADYDAAQSLVEQAMLQEPEGKDNATARRILGDTYFARGNYVEAAKAFVALALLYNDPTLTPLAMKRASEAYAKAGQADQAQEWRNTLKKKYPNYN